MVDDWLLEHLAKVTTLSCVLIVLYFLIYSIWRISQMPNYPWNWNDWQWTLGRGNAMEIIRTRTEMPFTVSLDDNHKEVLNESVVTVNYLKDEPTPDITVFWGPTASYLMKLINAPWHKLLEELEMMSIEEGQWRCNIDSLSNNNNNTGTAAVGDNSVNYFVLQRLKMDTVRTVFASDRQTNQSISLILKPPIDFDWHMLKNQFRYPVALFVTNSHMRTGWLPSDGDFKINGLISVFHIKNDVFLNASTTLAQYIKMSNAETHILQSLYVIDDPATNNDAANVDGDASDSDDNSPLTEESADPFNDVICSVCQVSPVTRVIIPCRHLCLCTACFEKVEICPICRGAIMYYFKTREDPRPSSHNSHSSHHSTNFQSSNSTEESQNLTLWQRLEAFNDRFSYATGLIRQY